MFAETENALGVLCSSNSTVRTVCLLLSWIKQRIRRWISYADHGREDVSSTSLPVACNGKRHLSVRKRKSERNGRSYWNVHQKELFSMRSCGPKVKKNLKDRTMQRTNKTPHKRTTTDDQVRGFGVGALLQDVNSGHIPFKPSRPSLVL